MDKGKKVEYVPKKKHHFSTTEVGWSVASPPLPCSEVLVEEKLMAASTAISREAQKKSTKVDPLSNDCQRRQVSLVGRLWLIQPLVSNLPSLNRVTMVS